MNARLCAMQAKKAAKKQQLLQKMASGDPTVTAEGQPLLPQQQEQQNGAATVVSGKGDVAVATKGEAAALLRAAEKLGAK